jgi:hypothetical protein
MTFSLQKNLRLRLWAWLKWWRTCLPSKHEALSSNSSTTKKKRRRRGGREEGREGRKERQGGREEKLKDI